MAETDSVFPEVDDALGPWRQGDCVIGEQWFAHRFALDCPVADAAKGAAFDLLESPVKGFVIVSQTCDVVRLCHERPYVEVAALVTMDADDDMNDVAHCRRPRFAYVPGIAEKRLVADLDLVMTIEKPVVAQWARTVGCRNDSEVRAFGEALARKRQRFAFPDDFTELAGPFRNRVLDKHWKNSPEGVALRSLREIRVRAAPDWDANEVELFFWFIRDDGTPADCSGHLSKWLGLLRPSEKYTSIDGAVVALEDLNAREYVDSDPLDLEQASIRRQ